MEERNGKLSAFEFKWAPYSKARIPKTFTNNYEVETHIIDRKNFREFVMI